MTSNVEFRNTRQIQDLRQHQMDQRETNLTNLERLANQEQATLQQERALLTRQIDEMRQMGAVNNRHISNISGNQTQLKLVNKRLKLREAALMKQRTDLTKACNDFEARKNALKKGESSEIPPRPRVPALPSRATMTHNEILKLAKQYGILKKDRPCLNDAQKEKALDDLFNLGLIGP